MKILGIENIGSTCYFSSVLQSILYLKDIRYYFKTQNGDSKVFREIKDVMENIRKGGEKIKVEVLNPRPLLELFKIKFPWWEIYQQQDAHECWVNFIDFLQSNTKDKNQAFQFESSRNGYSKYIDYINKNPSIISNLFFGISSQYRKCSQCKNVSRNYEIVNTINLNVPTKMPTTLVELLQDYIKKETRSDPDNLYECDKCKDKVVCTEKVGFYKLPKILVICLKRYDYSSYPPRKIGTLVNYPINSLRIREEFTDKVKEYKLQSIILHHGGFFGGHYTCMSKFNGLWFHFNDDYVTPVDRIDKQKQAYMLVYSCIN